ncbi:MAG: M23 family metallopeptidase, partial [Flavobacteriales bacterium]
MNAQAQVKIVALALILLGCTVLGKLHGQGLDGPDFQDFGKYSGLMAPLDIPLILAGNFGELRADHFHTGLDFKTQGREGFPVIAAADGVVARVKISPNGYGRAIYLSSPEGLTTVYAHLQRFAPVVEQWALDRQYERQTFAIDEAPKRAFAFSQGDTIGWSG